ncbi:uncharacterized protein H6S33_002493 [Morchella sextelata]|uniref:uncharacterized protein n=1 Tax=Morchella sextelata TaxID=1174677 RepID=UPI001D0380D6|nr:uncharacterized protein H6S33_002493 [Morchella sextelata]KAH0607459.1 hypothetical protein H6S33_002493 [Morchella sextelata]
MSQKLARTIPSLATLRHVQFSRRGVPFLKTSALQAKLTTDLQAAKSFFALPRRSVRPAAADQPFPPPTLLTMEFEPVFTLGRRDRRALAIAERERLLGTGAKVYETLRGGQTTFHGPGQMTGYVVIDLVQHKLTPRCYVALLEDAMIETCAHYGVATVKTENTGVWVRGGESKIGAVGVHMRRNVTSYGVALNVTTDLRWFDLIVPCGLEGKGTTSLEKEGVRGVGAGQVAAIFAEIMREKLGCEQIESLNEWRLFEWIEGRTIQSLAGSKITDFTPI